MAERFYIKRQGDQSTKENTAYIVKLNGYLMPSDIQYDLSFDKMVAESQILDGAIVYERVTRKAVQIDFKFTVRSYEVSQPERVVGIFGKEFKFPEVKTEDYYFPDTEFSEFYTKVFKIDNIIQVENSFINKLGITELVVRDMQVETILGNTDIRVKLKCSENYVPQSSLQADLEPVNSFSIDSNTQEFNQTV